MRPFTSGLHIDHDETSEAEWHAEKELWEQKKASDQARIEEQLDHLANAWKELESEQRRLLTLGQAATVEADSTPAPQNTRKPSASLDLVDTTGRTSSTSAANQFQKLKREILQQSRRTH